MNNAINNMELDSYHVEAMDTYYYLIHGRFNNEHDVSHRTSVVHGVAQNIYDYINNKYQSLKDKYGDNVYNDNIENLLAELLTYATEENTSTDLNHLYSMYEQLVNEIDYILSVDIEISFNCPYAILMMNGYNYNIETVKLGTRFDITEYIIYYENQGFEFESVVLDEQPLTNYYELEGRYYIDISSENGFTVSTNSYSLDFKYSISNYSIAQPIIEQYVDDSIQTLKEQASSVGVDITIYDEYINAIYEASANIIDETTYQNYVDACNELKFVVSKDNYIASAQSEYNELLKKYPELLEDSQFSTYNTYYENILLGMQNSTTIEELVTYRRQFTQLYYNVSSYAESLYGVRN